MRRRRFKGHRVKRRVFGGKRRGRRGRRRGPGSLKLRIGHRL